MKNFKIILLSVLLTAGGVFSGCTSEDNSNPERDEFQKQTIAGVYRGSAKIFQYTEEECQYAFSTTSLTSRIQTDAMNKYIHVRLLKSPFSGTEVESTISALGIGGLKQEQTLNLLVVKTQNDLIWLWDNDSATGYLMPWN